MLIAGCGYVGSVLAHMLIEDGCTVWGLRRQVETLPPGVRPVGGDVTDPATLDGIVPEPDAIVYAVAPAGREEEAYRDAYVTGLEHVVRAAAGDGRSYEGRLVLISSTGVYGEAGGGWVKEDTPPHPADAKGAALLEGERLATTLGSPGIVLRLGGIYGPGRDRIIRRVRSGEANCPEPDRYTNRIHRTDAAGAARHLLSLPNPDALYLGVDRDPAPLRAVYSWLAERLGVPDPCDPTAMTAERDSAPSRRNRTNKRCSSDRLVEAGYDFRYPTFREGYARLLEG